MPRQLAQLALLARLRAPRRVRRTALEITAIWRLQLVGFRIWPGRGVSVPGDLQYLAVVVAISRGCSPAT